MSGLYADDIHIERNVPTDSNGQSFQTSRSESIVWVGPTRVHPSTFLKSLIIDKNASFPRFFTVFFFFYSFLPVVETVVYVYVVPLIDILCISKT